jgi:citrate synthase
MTEGSGLIRGLEGVVAAETQLCDLDGANGRLAYRGYDIADLAQQSTFEQVTYLLLHGDLPKPAQLDGFVVALTAARAIPGELVQAFRLMPKDTDPMRVLQAAVAILGMSDPDTTDNSHAANVRKAVRLTSQVATAICAHHRVRSGKDPVTPAAGLGHAANFLYMLTGERPNAAAVKAFDASLTLYAEHELNASTFTTRAIVSTQSDMHSAVAGGVGALKGPLHGGAPSKVLDMLNAIGSTDNVDTWLTAALDRGERLMGFGHRVYKAEDPRAEILRDMAETASDPEFFRLSKLTEDRALAMLNERKPGRRLYTNVEFYSAGVLAAVGLPGDMFTPTFAVSRSVGWSAHVLEQVSNNRLIRPQSQFVGPTDRKFTPIADR